MSGVGVSITDGLRGRGAVGGSSLPWTNCRISGAVTFAKDAIELLLHAAARVTPISTGVGRSSTSAAPLSPPQGEPEPEKAQRRTALLAFPSVRHSSWS